MIPVPSGVRVWLAVGRTDMRRGMNGLALQVQQALGRDLPDRVGERATLVRHVQAWQQRRNAAAIQADWQFTTKDARIKLRKLYPIIEG